MSARDATRARRFAIPVLGVGLLLALAAPPAANAARFISGNDNGSLGYFTSAKPQRFIQLEVAGLDNEAEDFAGLDVRPETGQLWALTQHSNEYRAYRIRLNVEERTATATKRPGGGPFAIAGVDDNNAGFAFDPVRDEMRLTDNGSHANRTLDPVAFTVGMDTDFAYAPGDPNEGTEPGVQALGYTNQRKGADRTKLYGIDEDTDSLVRVKPASSGALNTVGPLDVNTTFGFDFDISTRGSAFAMLRAGFHRLFRIDLRTGEADALGRLGKPNKFGVIEGWGRPFSTTLVPGRLVR